MTFTTPINFLVQDIYRPGDPAIGTAFSLTKIGEGGSAIVYRAKLVDLENRIKVVVIKFFKMRLVDAEVDRILKEASIHIRLREIENVSQLIGVIYPIDDHHKIGFVLNYIEGLSLYEWILINPPTVTPFPKEIFTDLFKRILTIMKSIHNVGITHSDATESNFIINKDNQIQLIDFGLSYFDFWKKNPKYSTTTIFYLSPEGTEIHKHGMKIDIWAIGCIFYNCLTHRTFFYDFYGKVKEVAYQRSYQLILDDDFNFNFSKIKQILDDFYRKITLLYRSKYKEEPTTNEINIIYNIELQRIADATIETTVEGSFQPLLRKLLAVDPAKRVGAQVALKDELFEPYGMSSSGDLSDSFLQEYFENE